MTFPQAPTWTWGHWATFCWQGESCPLQYALSKPSKSKGQMSRATCICGVAWEEFDKDWLSGRMTHHDWVQSLQGLILG